MMINKIKRRWWKLKAIYHYLKINHWCRRFHRPLFSGIGGYGGRDVFGRRRKAYYTRRCTKCGIHCDQNGEPKPLTDEQNKTCAKIFGSMWVGPHSEHYKEDVCPDCEDGWLTRGIYVGQNKECETCNGTGKKPGKGMKKDKVGQCVICGGFGIQNKEVFKLGGDYDEDAEKVTDCVGWAHEACVLEQPGSFEGAGSDDHGDDWKKPGEGK